MLDHILFGIKDFEKSKEFYLKALQPIGYSLVMEVDHHEGKYVGFGKDGKPYFWISSKSPAVTGLHAAFTVDKRETVNLFYESAMEAGGKDNGKPGIRAHYHPNYYGAFVFDLDGNNIEAVCHKPE